MEKLIEEEENFMRFLFLYGCDKNQFEIFRVLIERDNLQDLILSLEHYKPKLIRNQLARYAFGFSSWKILYYFVSVKKYKIPRDMLIRIGRSKHKGLIRRIKLCSLGRLAVTLGRFRESGRIKHAERKKICLFALEMRAFKEFRELYIEEYQRAAMEIALEKSPLEIIEFIESKGLSQSEIIVKNPDPRVLQTKNKNYKEIPFAIVFDHAHQNVINWLSDHEYKFDLDDDLADFANEALRVAMLKGIDETQNDILLISEIKDEQSMISVMKRWPNAFPHSQITNINVLKSLDSLLPSSPREIVQMEPLRAQFWLEHIGIPKLEGFEDLEWSPNLENLSIRYGIYNSKIYDENLEILSCYRKKRNDMIYANRFLAHSIVIEYCDLRPIESYKEIEELSRLNLSFSLCR